jgi:hypothetical protein
MTAETARAESTAHYDRDDIERLIAAVAARLEQDATRGFRLPQINWCIPVRLIGLALIVGGATAISTALITGNSDPSSPASPLISTAAARHSDPTDAVLRWPEEALYPVLPKGTETKAQPVPPSPDEPAKSGASRELTSTQQSLGEETIALLLSQGDVLLSRGDATSGRLFYNRAVEAGSAQAALRLGASYDPSFLSRAGVRGVRGDPALAAYWYQRAHALGAGAKADALLKGINAR